MAGATYTGMPTKPRTAPKPRADVLVPPESPAAPTVIQAPKPTFQPPAPVQADPRVSALQTELAAAAPQAMGPNPKLSELSAQIEAQIAQSQQNRNSLRTQAESLTDPSTVRAPDFSGQQAQRGQLQALITELMAGRGPAVGDVTNDPAAQAYSLQKRRAAERLRGTAANRLAASGVSGSGEFDTEVLGINEAAGEDIARFSADLANQRRGEMTQTALSGAQLSLSDLDRSSQSERDRFEAELAMADRSRLNLMTRADMENSADDSSLMDLQRFYETLAAQDADASSLALQRDNSTRAGQSAALSSLTGEQSNAQGVNERAGAIERDAPTRALEQELLALQLQDAKRRSGASGSTRVGGRGVIVPQAPQYRM